MLVLYHRTEIAVIQTVCIYSFTGFFRFLSSFFYMIRKRTTLPRNWKYDVYKPAALMVAGA